MSECAHAPAAPPSSVAGARAVRNSLPRQGFTSLRSSASFSTVYRNGIRHRKGPLLVLQTVGVEGHTRVGFVAGRKVGNAVQRNRAKRRLREAVRRVHLPAGHDFVVVASPECTTAPFDVLVASITNAVEANTMKLGSAPR